MYKLLFLLLLISFENVYSVETDYIVSAVSSDIDRVSRRSVNVVIADKSKGVLYLKRPEQETVVIPALFGMQKSDDFTRWEIDKITPAGSYELEKAYSVKMKSNILMFKKSNKNILAIHPVFVGIPSQKRIERLTNGTPEDNRITSGCINVMPEFFDLLFALPNKTRLVILPEEQKLEDSGNFF